MVLDSSFSSRWRWINNGKGNDFFFAPVPVCGLLLRSALADAGCGADMGAGLSPRDPVRRRIFFINQAFGAAAASRPSLLS